MGVATLRIRARPGRGQVDSGAGAGRRVGGRAGTGPAGRRRRRERLHTQRPEGGRPLEAQPELALTRAGSVLEVLGAGGVEQKVAGQEAWRGWRLLCAGRERGSRAGWPVACGLCPRPRRWRCCLLGVAAVPCRSHEVGCDRAGGEGRARRSSARSTSPRRKPTEGSVRCAGIGVWTSAEIRQRAHGHADAVSFGDYDSAAHVGYALTGEPFDDARLAELLVPDRPHRYRIQHLVTTRMAGAPRHGPRMAPRTHLPA